jgi:hypothetical protein
MRRRCRRAACIPCLLATSVPTDTKLHCIQGLGLLGNGGKEGGQDDKELWNETKNRISDMGMVKGWSSEHVWTRGK